MDQPPVAAVPQPIPETPWEPARDDVQHRKQGPLTPGELLSGKFEVYQGEASALNGSEAVQRAAADAPIVEVDK